MRLWDKPLSERIIDLSYCSPSFCDHAGLGDLLKRFIGIKKSVHHWHHFERLIFDLHVFTQGMATFRHPTELHWQGIYHIGYAIPSAFGLFVTHGSLFALALSGFVWQNNWRIGSYHCFMGIMTLLMPQWVFGVSTGEAAAMYCFYSIPITASFMPYFKTIFKARPQQLQMA
jgi:hypothetical protein